MHRRSKKPWNHVLCMTMCFRKFNGYPQLFEERLQHGRVNDKRYWPSIVLSHRGSQSSLRIWVAASSICCKREQVLDWGQNWVHWNTRSRWKALLIWLNGLKIPSQEQCNAVYFPLHADQHKAFACLVTKIFTQIDIYQELSSFGNACPIPLLWRKHSMLGSQWQAQRKWLIGLLDWSHQAAASAVAEGKAVRQTLLGYALQLQVSFIQCWAQDLVTCQSRN